MSEDMLHPEPARLEALAESSLPEADRATVASHVETCERCAAEVEQFRVLFAALAELPQLAPSADFADRVMASVQVAPVPEVVPARTALADRVRRLLPGKRTRWSLAAALSGLPVVTVGAAVAWLIAQPDVSVQALWIFATQRVGAGVTGGASWVVETLAATRLGSWAGAFGRGIAAIDPSQLGFAAAGFAVLAITSAWVLYSNLIRPPTRERQHVSYSF
ncbi:MAG: hypothetical protein ABFS34_14325 [Gemmatimonadota bacterium]